MEVSGEKYERFMNVCGIVLGGIAHSISLLKGDLFY
jgi:hypothetical protein